MSGYIYILREREFIASGELTYKVGRTADICKRMRAYPKGSMLLFNISVVDMNETEKQVLGIFKDKFIQRLDFGREYFLGDVESMAATIVAAVRMHTNHVEGTHALTKIDPTIAVIRFVESKIDDLSDKTLKSKAVYESFFEWANTMQYHVSLSNCRFTQELGINFGVCHGVHRFADGVDRALYFPMLHLSEYPEHETPAALALEMLKPLSSFIHAMCSVGRGNKVHTSVFLSKFHMFCAENGLRPRLKHPDEYHAKTLSKDMGSLGFDNKLCRMVGFRGHCFIGLDFKDIPSVEAP